MCLKTSLLTLELVVLVDQLLMCVLKNEQTMVVDLVLVDMEKKTKTPLDPAEQEADDLALAIGSVCSNKQLYF